MQTKPPTPLPPGFSPKPPTCNVDFHVARQRPCYFLETGPSFKGVVRLGSAGPLFRADPLFRVKRGASHQERDPESPLRSPSSPGSVNPDPLDWNQPLLFFLPARPPLRSLSWNMMTPPFFCPPHEQPHQHPPPPPPVVPFPQRRRPAGFLERLLIGSFKS